MYLPPASTTRKTFWGWTRIAFVVSAVILWSDEHAKVAELTAKLNAKPETPPSTTVNIPPIVVPPSQVVIQGDKPKGSLFWSKQEMPAALVANSPYPVNIHLTNRGGREITDAYWTVTGSFEKLRSGNSNQSDREVFGAFLKNAKAMFVKQRRNKEARNPEYFGIGDDHWGTLPMVPTKEEIQGILDGSTRLYLMTYAEWDGGQSTYKDCRWLQPPADANYGDASKLIFHICAK